MDLEIYTRNTLVVINLSKLYIFFSISRDKNQYNYSPSKVAMRLYVKLLYYKEHKLRKLNYLYK